MNFPSHLPTRRRGSIVPMMAACVTVLFGFVALAIDIGMVIIARSSAQNAADTAALAGARTLDNRVPIGTLPDNYDNQKGLANTTARASVTTNSTINANLFQTTSVKVGVYDYDPISQTFRPVGLHGLNDPNAVPFVPDAPTAKPAGKAWTAVEVNVSASQPAFFARVLGVNSLPASAKAVAVHRPRDVALVLDMSGSMKFASTYAWPPGTASSTGVVSGLMNPDPTYPRFGHYHRYPTTTLPNAFMRTTLFTAGSNEIFSPTNMTVDEAVGPAIVRQFVFDPGNLATPATTVPNVANANALRNAFHRWNPPGMTASTASGEFGTMSQPTGWTGYDAFDTSNTSGPTPAPSTFATQEDSAAAKYVGDRAPRKAGAIFTDGTSWDATTTTGTARNLWELLYPTSVTTQPALTTASLRTTAAARNVTLSGTTFDSRARVALVGTTAQVNTAAQRESGSGWDKYVDGAWEMAGYDLDVAAYVAGKTTPQTARDTAAAKAVQSVPAFPTNGRFHGYSMGPAYYGKTFFQWPPDPRWGDPSGSVTPLGGGVRPDLVLATTNTSSTDQSKMVKDSSGNWIADWRRRFFLRGDSVDTGAVNSDPMTTAQAGTWKYFNPQGDNDVNTAGTQNVNQALLNSSTGHTLKASFFSGSTRNFRVNYRAVLAWIKSGPQVLPPNLRSGRIKFYSSIPDHVDNAGAPGTNEANLDQRFWREYIDYVLGYTANEANYDPRYMLAGTETAQWAARNVSIGATAGETYTISTTSYTNRMPYMNYTDVPARPRLHFWFGPMSMLMFISGREGASGLRNWNPGSIAEAQTWQLKAGVRSAMDDIKNNHPNDQVGTAYFAGANFTTIRAEMGQDWNNLKNALYYPKSLLLGIKNGTGVNTEKRPYNSSFDNALVGDLPNGNGGTDPVSGFALAYNLLSSATAINGTGRRGASKIVIFETDGVPNTWRDFSFTPAGPNSYYTSTGTTGSGSNGDATSINKAMDAIDQIVAPVAANGFSADNSPARVYPIAFGDLFSSTSSAKGQALTFLQDVAFHGQTSESAATPLPAYQIIIGTAQQRIDGLKTTFERIMQSGVQVTLIE